LAYFRRKEVIRIRISEWRMRNKKVEFGLGG
jgi:hypothetical protein